MNTSVPVSTIRAAARPFWATRRCAGITRVARLTGLDRTGVEVASAIRPTGHVLQVSNGKGERFAEAARGAVLEAAELFASEWPPPGDGPLWLVKGRDLLTGEPLLVPAGAVYCPAPGARPVGGPAVRWTSNGMGAHPSRSAALLHALLEAAERDQLARALPCLWTRGAVRRRLVDRASLARAAPRTARLARRVERGGFEVYLFDLSPSLLGDGSRSRSGPGLDLRLPVAGALLFDLRDGPVPAAAGYACALTRDAALRGALLEAAQSRLTDIHGAREDVQGLDPLAARQLREWCRAAPAARRAAAMPSVRVRGTRAAIAAVLERLRRAGRGPLTACDLAPPGLGVHVVKVVAPGLRLSELL